MVMITLHLLARNDIYFCAGVLSFLLLKLCHESINELLSSTITVSEFSIDSDVESNLQHNNMAIRALSPDLEAVTRQELNEDPERLEQDLKHIRDWLAKQPHLTARKGKKLPFNDEKSIICV